MPQKTVAIIGGGSAALMAALSLSPAFDVHIYEKGKTIGRKFLVAGNGGFNLTNGATGTALYQEYTQHSALQKSLQAFDSKATRNWLQELNIPTFIGSSGRVFPEKGIKPIHVLQQIKKQLEAQQVHLHCKHDFMGFDAQKKPIIRSNDIAFSLEADYYIFALGGASWSVTGSNQVWKQHFEALGISCSDFESSNCGVEINWDKSLLSEYVGQPLKNIQLQANDKSIKGEAVISNYGLEGNAVYPIIPAVRSSLKQQDTATIYLDLKPHNTLESLLQKVASTTIKPKNYSYILKLNKTQLALAKSLTDKATYLSSKAFVKAIKQLPITVTALRPIEEAISTIGGINMSAINNNFSLKAFPDMFVIGEMLNWDAPTGGFLLQGCFSTAVAATSFLNKTL